MIEFKGSEKFLSYRAGDRSKSGELGNGKGVSRAAAGRRRRGRLVAGAGDDETPVTIVIPKAELPGDSGLFGVDAETEWTEGE